jgi:rhodanese-related sulfurtransferase
MATHGPIGEHDSGKHPLERRGAGMNAKGSETDLISCEELKEKLERGDDFKLVMVLGEWEYRAKRIPGSLRVSTPEEGLEALDLDSEIVLYDSGPACPASRMALRFLKAHGYERVNRYAGGLEEWESVGYPLEGEGVG